MHEVTVEFLGISRNNDATNTSFSLLLAERVLPNSRT